MYTSKFLTFKGFIALLLAGILIVMSAGCSIDINETKNDSAETIISSVEEPESDVFEEETESENENETAPPDWPLSDSTHEGATIEDIESESGTEIESENGSETEQESQEQELQPSTEPETITPTVPAVTPTEPAVVPTEAPTQPASQTQPAATQESSTEQIVGGRYRRDLEQWVRQTIVNNVKPNAINNQQLKAYCDKYVKIYAEANGDFYPVSMAFLDEYGDGTGSGYAYFCLEPGGPRFQMNGRHYVGSASDLVFEIAIWGIDNTEQFYEVSCYEMDGKLYWICAECCTKREYERLNGMN